MISVINVIFEAEAWWESRIGVRQKIAYLFLEAVFSIPKVGNYN